MSSIALYLTLQRFFAPPLAHADTVEIQYVMGTDLPRSHGGIVLDDRYVWIADYKGGLWRVERYSEGRRSSLEDSSGYVGTGGALYDLWYYNSTGNYPANPDAGYYIYAAAKSGFLNVYDTARPGDKYVTGVNIGGGVAYGVYATGPARHKVYVATTLGLQVYDIADPGNPVRLTTIRPDLDFVAARGEPDYRYMVATSLSDNRLYIIDTADDSVAGSLDFGPPKMSFDTTGTIRRPWLGADEAGNRYVYVVNGYGDLWIVNLNDPAVPVILSFWNSPHDGATTMPGGNVWVRQGYAYITTATGNQQSYLYVLDVHDPAQPVLVDYLYDSVFGFNEVRGEGCEIHIATADGWKMYTMTGWQPDAWISRSDRSNYVGQDVYEDPPALQVKEQTVVPGQTATYRIRIENEASLPDRFYVSGTMSAAGWTVRYLQGATDITAAVVAGSYLSDLLRPGQYLLLTLEVTPDPGAPCSERLDITVIADSWMCPTGQCSGATDVVSAYTTLGCPQMTVAKEDGRSSVLAGDDLPYVITFANSGDAAAAGVVVTDTLPAGTSYVSANPAPTGITARPDGTTHLTWHLGTIPAASGPYTVTLHGRVNVGVKAGDLLTNTVTLGYTDLVGNPYPAVSAEDVDKVAASPLLKAVDKMVANAGQVLAYTVTVGYLGDELLGDASVTDTIPFGTAYLADSATAGGVYVATTNTIRWTLGSNRPGIPGISAPTGSALCPAPLLVFTADRDTHIRQDRPEENFGTDDPLRTNPRAGTQKHALIHFNLSSIPADAVIQSAILRVLSADSHSNHFVQVRKMLTEWTESGATWNKRDGTSSWAAGAFSSADYGTTIYGTFTPVGGDTQVAVNVTNLAQEWLSNNRGLVMLATGTDGEDASWNSRENGSSTRRPALEVRYLVPSPGGCSDTEILSPAADTFIEKGNPTRNNGGGTTMSTNPGNNNTTNNTRYSLLRFDLVGIPQGAMINSAVLDLYVSTARSSNHSDSVRPMLTAWTEAGATWNSRDGTNAWAGGAAFGSNDYAATTLGNITPNSAGHRTLDIAAAVTDWLNNGGVNNGLVLLSTGTDNGDARYSTREEENNPDHQPSLAVSWNLPANPGPGTRTTLSAWPLLVGTAGQVTVTMQVTADGTVAGVTPPADLALNAVGAMATRTAGPAPAGPVTVTPDAPATFTYVYEVTPGSTPGEVVFSGHPSSSDAHFATATSNGVLVVPPLTFRATVNDPTAASRVLNQAHFQDGNAYPAGARSNPVETWLGGSIGDTVWHDADGDGVQDVTEGGIAGVVLRLTHGTDVYVATTDTEGHYLFELLPAGSYDITVDPDSLPPGLALTTGNLPLAVTLNPGQQHWAADFGYDDSGILAGTVFRDPNGNAVQDAGEAGLPNVNVKLYADNNGDGVLDDAEPLLATVVSDAGGHYSFTGLPPALGPAAGYLLYADEEDPDLPADYRSTAATPRATTLTAGQTKNDLDFGFTLFGSIGDRVWEDLDGDGVQGMGEPGLGGVQLILSGPIGTLYATTASDGFYTFDDLPVGIYSIAVNPATVPAGYGLTTGNDSLAIALEVGEGVTTADFGYDGTGVIAGTIWADLNGNGVQDGAEDGISNVAVWLYLDVNGNRVPDPSDRLINTDVTDAGHHAFSQGVGRYSFTGLPPGTYLVDVDQADPNMPAYSSTTADPLPVNLAPGQTRDDADSGFGPFARLGDAVWNDLDGDGEQEPGEPGLAGVALTLTDGSHVYTATTDVAGYYIFAALAPNSYTLTAATPPGYTLTTGNLSYAATLAAGDYHLTADFGFRGVGSIGGLAWSDLNCNGIFEPDLGETGLPDAAVFLFRDLNGNGWYEGSEPLLDTGRTDATGHYLLAGLPAGHYTVLVQLNDPALPPGTGPTTYQPIPINLAPGQSYLAADFGFGSAGAIGGAVYYDTNDNGERDQGTAAEYGIPNVTLRLYRDNNGNGIVTRNLFRNLTFTHSVQMLRSDTIDGDDALLTTATTDANGLYFFGGLVAGNYIIQVDEGDPDIPAGLQMTTPNPYPVPGLEVGQFYEDADFGFWGNGSVSGVVFSDLNASGTREYGEPGISGVSISLYTAGPDGLWGTADDVLIATTVTGSDGSYTFSDLSAGVYRVVETDPPGHASTSPNAVVVSVLGGATADFGDIVPTAVLVTAFTAHREPDGVHLRWTVIGFPAQGFDVYRATHPKGPYDQISAGPVFSDGEDFEYLDRGAEPGVVYWYKLHLPADGSWFGPITGAAMPRVRVFMPIITR